MSGANRAGVLVSAEGEVFRGRSVGASGVAVGEAVFNTSMTGYQEILTDPSYAGQIVVMTSTHIGNVGVTAFDDQAQGPAASGLVVRSLSRRESNWRSQGTLSSFLHDHGVVAVADVDTRRLTRYLRDRGAMPFAIGDGSTIDELTELAAAAPAMAGLDLASRVSTSEVYRIEASTERQGTVVAIDLGMKRDIGRQLAARGLDVVVVPHDTDAETILAHHPDGVFLSNGPGDPEPLTETVESVRGVLGKVPVFGICLGNQILGLALGAGTFKLPFGHHGGNHPVRRLSDGKVEITSQNHGFAVDLWSLHRDQSPPDRRGLVTADQLPSKVDTDFGYVEPTHQNLNDGTLEGLRCLDIVAYAVQYHPEAAPGPSDADYLFDDFLEVLDTERKDAS